MSSARLLKTVYLDVTARQTLGVEFSAKLGASSAPFFMRRRALANLPQAS